MKTKVTVIVLIMIGWFSFSTYWYVCEISNLCETEESDDEQIANYLQSYQHDKQQQSLDQTAQEAVQPEEGVEEPEPEEPAQTPEEPKVYEVFFKPDSAELTDDDQNDETLELVAQQALDNPDKKVVLTGYTAAVSSEETIIDDDLLLASDRAQNVKSQLVKLKVPEDQISIVAKSDDQSNSSEESNNNRRVSIELK